MRGERTRRIPDPSPAASLPVAATATERCRHECAPTSPLPAIRAPMKKSRPAVFALLALASNVALAQGGPPMVTDDPETPGDGKWEINLGGFGSRTATRREINFPDADI